MTQQYFTIGTLSARTGIHIETIRFYEKRGLVPPPPRSEGGYRQYGDDHVKRLVFIRRTRELGFSLEEISGLLDLVDAGNYTCGQIEGLTQHQLDNVRAKIADLRRLEKTLAKMLAQCEGGTVPDCPVIDALYPRLHA